MTRPVPSPMQEGPEMSTTDPRQATERDGEHRHAPPPDPVTDRRRFVRSMALGGAAVAAGVVAGPLVAESVASAQTSTTLRICSTLCLPRLPECSGV